MNDSRGSLERIRRRLTIWIILLALTAQIVDLLNGVLSLAQALTSSCL